jgi:adenylate cyclase
MREQVEMTVLFADIRGFSQMMNHVELEAIIDFLDEFYSIMTRIVFESGGSNNKFIGDEIMPFFGAPIALENATENGVKAGLEMVTSFAALKGKFSEVSPHFGNLGIGIGIDTGKVFVGSVGSKKRYDYTVIGNAVNAARRLCSHAGPDEVLTVAETVTRLKGDFVSQFVEKKSFKGMPEDMEVYRLQSGRRHRLGMDMQGESGISGEKALEKGVI